MAIVPANVCSSRVVSGIRNPWLAITRLTRIRAAPTSPGTIVPGKRKISTAMQARPRMKSKTSSQPAVPPRKWLQNKSRKHAAATSPPTPWPGAMASMYSPVRPTIKSRPVISHQLRNSTAISTPVGSMTCNSLSPYRLASSSRLSMSASASPTSAAS